MTIYKISTVILLVAILTSCEQEKLSNESKLDKLTITVNSDTSKIYTYSNNQALKIKEFFENGDRETIFEYNSENILINMRIIDQWEYEWVYRFDYNRDKITEIDIYKIIDGIEEKSETKILEYDSSGSLVKIDATFPETFKCLNSNTFMYGSVSNLGVWIDKKYELDSRINPFSTIGLPLIFPESILKNNSLSSTSSWNEYYDCMLNDDHDCIDQKRFTELDYTSRFEYNQSGLPSIEYRDSQDKVDTLKFFYN